MSITTPGFFLSFYFNKKLFIYLFIWLYWVFVAACGLSLVAIHVLLVVIASLNAEPGL